MAFMSNNQRHQDRTKFLQLYRPIWHREMLQHYPQSLADYPLDWLNYLNDLPDHEQWQFDAFAKLPPNTPPTLTQFIQNIQQLKDCPTLAETVENPHRRMGLTPKKDHEIHQLLTLLQQNRPEVLVDIGGGVGHLSAIVKHELGIDTICIEANADFVHYGEIKRNKLRGRGSITHVHAMVPAWSDLVNLTHEHALDQYWPVGATSLGLHTCGPLSLSHFAFAKRRLGPLINLACCYNRLHPDHHTNLASSNKLEWTGHALTLAARGHFGFSFDHFLMKKRVKIYRYALELFLQRQLQLPGFTSIGESNIKKYRVSFSQFALEKLAQILPGQHIPSHHLDSFFQDENLQQELKTMFSTNLVRWCFGRLLEIHLLYDRVLYLEQQGMKVQWGTLFDEQLSPRNIAICAEF